MKIILGSASPRRKKILTKLGLEFEVVPADIDEKSIRHEVAETLTRELAHAKSRAVRARLGGHGLVITADSVVECEGKIFEKSSSVEESRSFLLHFFGKKVSVITSLLVVNTETDASAENTDTGCVYLSELPEDVLAVASRNGFEQGTAGGFDINDPILTDYIVTSGDAETITGMSSRILLELLKKVTDR